MEDPQIKYTTRTAEQEVDTVEICPSHPDYMIIGTYSLVKKDDRRDYEAQVRRGTIQVMTVHPEFKPLYAGMLPPQLDRVTFPCAVLDIHFHPADATLLGVATSNAHVYFFRFIKHGDVLGRRVITKLLPLGSVRVSEDDEHGLTALVTQFSWFPELRNHGVSGISDVQDVSFAASTSFGETKIISMSVPLIKDLFDERANAPPAELPSGVTNIHKHELEAWTVAAVTLRSATQSQDNTIHRMILSGGDDSALIASAIELPCSPSQPGTPSISSSDEFGPTPMPLWKDRRNHTAGVVAILPLPSNDESPIPHPRKTIITGSYDEYLRIFELDTKTYRAIWKTELKLGGGVWRLKVLDQYTTPTVGDSIPHHHSLILSSLMHGGAAVVRLTYSADSDSWSITPLVTFRAGHESMVYCCDARLDNRTAEEAPPTYTVVSTSFYDMKICTWKFADHFKVHQNKIA
ncbi:hypothetical protein EDD37DRAFT_570449 [Exophiala viscosa]|uniref:uncharacterized protein n=1 Tax=Exophiala viscosa TaxID=2486360 RepID=UPI00219E5FDB|nr:hypothetical protein EDD37DRAFT_570449 [Exophiala viscosa]